jgi:hypothetical protein
MKLDKTLLLCLCYQQFLFIIPPANRSPNGKKASAIRADTTAFSE